MLKWLFLIVICAVALPAFCEPSAKYEVATIVDVKPHQSAGDSLSSAATIYVVLYTDTLGTSTVKYVAGREALVHVGKKAITYNDISGQSQEVPIINPKPATTISQAK